METNPRRLTLDPNLLTPNKQTLLLNVAAQAASMNMPCYLVGGCVRDLLLQKPVNDLDVIVEGNAIQLGEALVKTYGGKLTAHRKFATAVWDDFDLITARSETYAHAGALPTVTPSTIEDDLRRRDFTINAMALRLNGERRGELSDPLDGQGDLARGLIRVLHPRAFVDDPTRIFRAARYEQRYGFNIEADTLKLINQEALEVLAALSGERIRHEFDLIFEEENPALILSRLKELGVLEVFSLPEFDRKYSSLLAAKPSADIDVSTDRVALGYLLWLMDAPPALIAALSKRLDFTLALTADALSAAQLKTDLISFKDAKPSAWTFRLEKISPLSTYALWLATNTPALREFLVKWRYIKATITGDDLKARGILPGPQYKKILSQLRAAWLDGEAQNAKEELELLNTLL